MNDNIAPTVKAIAVIGAGTMGHGIAQVAAAAGYPVILREVDRDALARGVQAIERGKAGEEDRPGFYDWKDEAGDARRAHP